MCTIVTLEKQVVKNGFIRDNEEDFFSLFMHVPVLKNILQHYGLRPDKSFGQHFLCHEPILETIAQAVTGDHVVEIGPGPGTLTQHLCRKKDRSLVLVEKDKRLEPLLRETFPQTQVFIQDALDWDWSLWPGHHVVSNLPYNVSVPLILRYVQHSSGLGPAVFMVQKEVGQRLTALPNTKDYGRLSVMVQTYVQPQWIVTVPGSAFWPMPSVVSWVLTLKPKTFNPLEMPDFQALSQVVERAFSQRRKMLHHNLSLTKEEWDHLEIDPRRRAETLTLKEFAKITFLMKSKKI